MDREGQGRGETVMTGETKEKGTVGGKERGGSRGRHSSSFSDTLSQKPLKQSKEVRPSGK